MGDFANEITPKIWIRLQETDLSSWDCLEAEYWSYSRITQLILVSKIILDQGSEGVEGGDIL